MNRAHSQRPCFQFLIPANVVQGWECDLIYGRVTRIEGSREEACTHRQALAKKHRSQHPTTTSGLTLEVREADSPAGKLELKICCNCRIYTPLCPFHKEFPSHILEGC